MCSLGLLEDFCEVHFSVATVVERQLSLSGVGDEREPFADELEMKLASRKTMMSFAMLQQEEALLRVLEATQLTTSFYCQDSTDLRSEESVQGRSEQLQAKLSWQ